jgi:hypothetical protein
VKQSKAHGHEQMRAVEMTASDRCQSIFLDLLIAKCQAQNPSSCAYIRQLTSTTRCDEFYDFSSVRKSYAEHVGTDSMQRITDFEETKQDESRAAQAGFHYCLWTTQHLESALTWPNWLWYVCAKRKLVCVKQPQ